MSEPLPRRVVVTGLGAVSSLGIGAEAVAQALRAGRSGIGPIEQFDSAGFERTLAGEVRGFRPEEHLRRIDPRRWGRSAQFAAAAARLAVADSAMDPERLAGSRAGSSFGTTNGESAVLGRLAEQWVEDGLAALDPAAVAQADAGRIAAAANAELGLTGEAQTLGTACAASNYAIGYGYDQVRSGAADIMLCGGADASNRATHAGFHRLGALAEDVPRPFDAHRDGIVTAEGGVALLLEPLEAARERGARIYAEVLGYGMTCDARHMTNPDAASIAECVRRAHRNAGVKPHEVDYVCAHGTGTPANDRTEVAALREVFGDRLPPVSSIKSMLGHTMGAAAGFGALVSCVAIRSGFLPPSATVREVDPELGADLDCVPVTARTERPRVVQNHGFAFGGNNAITVFGEVSP
ncbi:beta-ketoacyl-[acyl-carrier-protein] synthase family protein [Marinitenerispora sediminis]|uniref:3-oxoacyl-ACP synthase n=1 Tax=Marinitenerispora sediminis TaxID=1931232 RepID=A0A368T675_9ACTN|nr:beta-ketoacyl-[acyl-carrier-protein] synthase family protein [Marinitenerispora sediminis]RCV48308.1 3-oxoacyl-ACP synthase [Marinitenerispora sediminis]RCV49424.1 3-oxoacyl-ACP synthase [Marinitenerispora sediminis]RCV59229.1 3-oxoacyl-ACP synthase [Marinitenerispora sediminis]